jgi:hypothetical protein
MSILAHGTARQQNTVIVTMKQKRTLMSVAMAAIVLVSLCAVGASALSVSAAQGSSNVRAPTVVGAPVGAGAPGVCSNNSTNLYLFIRGGADNALYLKISPDGTTWPSSETLLGGKLASAPAATSNYTGNVSVFVQGTDGALWWKNTSDGGVTWSTWTSLGGKMTANTGPAACSYGSNLAVFVQGTDGALWWKSSLNGGVTWSTWTSLGGKLKTSPAATAMSSPVQIGVFGVGTNGAVWYKHFSSGSWASWVSVGGQVLAGTSPAAYNWGSSHIGWFVTGTDSGLWHNWVGNSQGYESIGGVLTSSPSATAKHSGVIDVFGRGSTGQFAALYQTSFNYGGSGQWSVWTAIGGV